MNLIERVRDLLKQATTEHTHYYTANVLTEVLEVLEKLDDLNQTLYFQKKD